MTYLPSTRTTRRLLKIASLGFAGFLAGLFSGCNSSTVSAASAPAPLHISTDTEFSPSDLPDTNRLTLPKSIDARLIPALRHPPSARRLQFGSLHRVSQPTTPNGRSRS